MACCEQHHHHHKNGFPWHWQNVHYHHQHPQLHLCGKGGLWAPARGRQGRLGRRQQWRCVVWLGARGGRGWGEDLKIKNTGYLYSASFMICFIKTWGAIPISDMWGLGTSGGWGGFTITWLSESSLVDHGLGHGPGHGHLKLWIGELSITVLVGEGKHLLNILVLYRHLQHQVIKVDGYRLQWKLPASSSWCGQSPPWTGRAYPACTSWPWSPLGEVRCHKASGQTFQRKCTTTSVLHSISANWTIAFV